VTRATLPCVALAAAAAFLLACEPAARPAASTGPPPVLDAQLATRISEPLDALAARVPLAPDQDFRVVELGRSESTSHHVGAIRTAERPHRHDRHDLLVLLVRGHGMQTVGSETREVGEGSVLFVPRGVVHAFANAGPEPAIAYLVYAPPFDGVDRVQVAEGDAQRGAAERSSEKRPGSPGR
jgi:mannose-6-phosphate isomerase-like protein (cupin superfamily)